MNGLGGVKATADQENSGATGIRWTPWVSNTPNQAGYRRPWATRLRLQALRLLLALGTVALVFIAVRSITLSQAVSWPDIGNAALFALLLGLSIMRPQWVTPIAWLGLASLFINAVDGLDFHGEQVVTAAHILLPLFILYAALLGDLWMSLVAMIGVLGIYIATWIVHSDMQTLETLMLTNLMVLTVFSGAAALGVWWRHTRLEKRLDIQAEALRTELETRLKLQAMVTHDIRTPLTGLVNAAMLDDPGEVQELADRISRIVDSARELTTGSNIAVSVISVADVWKYTEETFSAALREKEQRLETSGDSSVLVEADIAILCNSVLGNFITNAIKFSPRGSTIRAISELEEGYVRVTVLDEGPGLPQGFGRHTLEGYRSSKGTEEEEGSGYGLHIAALCAARMGGRIELGTGRAGGAISVLLPHVHRSIEASPSSVDSVFTDRDDR